MPSNTMPSNALNVNALRQDTPGCAEDSVFLSSAGSSLQPRAVLDAVEGYAALETRVGGYEAKACCEKEFELVYDELARYLSCSRGEIALVENATRGWQSILSAIPFSSDDVIITTQSEYHSNVIPMLQLRKRLGLTIKVVPYSAQGEVCVDTLASMMDERVRLVALTHVPSNNGLVNNAEAIGEVVRHWNERSPRRALYLIDACQSVGQMPLDVRRLDCDYLFASGRKYLRGPRGTGFLYARATTTHAHEPLMLDGLAAEWIAADRYEMRADARKFETWEKNVGLFLGLGAAVRYLCSLDQDAVWSRIQELAAYTRTQLSTVKGVAVHDTGVCKSGIVTFSVYDRQPDTLWQALRTDGYFLGYTGVRSTRFDMESRGFESMLRASVHYFNTHDEIDQFVAVVERLSRSTTGCIPLSGW